MIAKWILLAVASCFAALVARDRLGGSGPLTPQQRTWLLVAAIFTAVSAFLFVRG